MEKFNMKEWLMENKSGMYSKINEINPALLGKGQEEADDEMEQQDDQNATMVNNVSMGLEEGRKKSTTIEIKEEPFFILGKEYIVDGTIDVTVEPDMFEDVIEDEIGRAHV